MVGSVLMYASYQKVISMVYKTLPVWYKPYWYVVIDMKGNLGYDL